MQIVTLTDRPDLVPAVAAWLHADFDHPRGPTLAQREAFLRAQRAPDETFVLFDGDDPVGTASLVAQDMSSRPELTPWLASVVVRPEFRGRGYSTALVRHVEARAAETADVLWLYTWTAAPLYAKLGWQDAGPERDVERGIPVVLMRRRLR